MSSPVPILAAGVLVTAISVAATSWLVSHLGFSETTPVTVHLASGIAAGLVSLGPLLLVVRTVRSFAQSTRSRIRDILASDQQPQSHQPRSDLLSLEAMFDPCIQEIRSAVEPLRARIRDLEIRHHVSESERQQVEVVLNALRDAVLVTNPFNEITIANDAAARTLGFDRQKAMHQPVDKVIANTEICHLLRDVNAHQGGEPRHVECEINVENEPRVFELSLSTVSTSADSPAGAVTILHDTTREREISQMKSDFVSKASHELRTPLSSIRAYVEMLVDGEAADEQSRTEFYRVIQSEADRLSRLIDNMLNISRIEAGIVQIDRVQVDLKSIISRAIETIDPQARTKDISIHSRFAEVSLSVEGDEDMLYQVVLNLLSNAVKYTPDGGRISVTSDSDNLTRSVVIGIADTGLGIPPESIPRLFDKFYRVENFKRVAKGTGLGLNLCKHIVETVHRGQIGVESRLGMGSRFWFSIPMRYAGSQAAA